MLLYNVILYYIYITNRVKPMDIFKRLLETLFENHQTKEFIENYTGILPRININSCSIKINFDDDNDKVLYILIGKTLYTNNNICIKGIFCGIKRKTCDNYNGPIENYSNDLLTPFLEEYSDYFRHGYVLK
jgi:hypothetical protein